MANDPSSTEWSVLVIRGGTVPELHGPYGSDEDASDAAEELMLRDDFDPVADRVFEVVRARSGQVDVQAYPERFYALREEG